MVQAEPLLQKVIQIHPNNARAHLGLAEIDRSLGFLDRSAEHYEKTLESMPGQAPIWRDYAEVLLSQRDFKTAELAIQKALDLSSEPASLIDFAFIARAQGRLDEATAILDAVLKTNPEREDVPLLRALWLLEAQRWPEAQAAALTRLKTDPGDPLAHWIYAQAALRQARRAEALEHLRSATKGAQRARFVAEAAQALLSALETRP